MKNRIFGFKYIELTLFALGFALLFVVSIFGQSIGVFKFYPISANLITSGGTQYSDTVLVDSTDRALVQEKYVYYNFDVGFKKSRAPHEIRWAYAFFKVWGRALDTTGTDPTAKWWVDVKDTSSTTWNLMTDTLSISAKTAFLADTAFGLIPLSKVTYLPMQTRFGFKSDSGREVFKVDAASYVEVGFVEK